MAFDVRKVGWFSQIAGYQRFDGFWQSAKCLAYLRPKKSWRKRNERFVRNFHGEKEPASRPLTIR